MPHKLQKPLILATLLTICSLLTGCGGGTAPPPDDPCITDPNLAGCVGGTSTTAASLNQENAALALSNSLHDILDITRIALATAIKSNELKTEILTVQNTYGIYQENNDETTGPVPSPTFACTNDSSIQFNGVNDIIIQYVQEGMGYEQSGTRLTVNFGGDQIDSQMGGPPDPALYCQIGDMKISGHLDLSNIIIVEDQPEPGSWTLTGKFFPTLVLHNSLTLTTIINPMSFEAIYNPDTGLTLAATVLSNSQHNPDDGTNRDGMVFTHFPAGSHPNTSPDATNNILLKGSIITARMDSPDPAFDPLATTLLSFDINGTILSNRTGTDVDMDIQTADSSASRQPLTWTNNIDVAPKIAPPGSGTFLITDVLSGNNIATTISTDVNRYPGDIDIVIIDNTYAPGDPGYLINQVTNWGVLMQIH